MSYLVGAFCLGGVSAYTDPFRNKRIQEHSFWNTPDGNHIFGTHSVFGMNEIARLLQNTRVIQQFPKEQNSGLWTK